MKINRIINHLGVYLYFYIKSKELELTPPSKNSSCGMLGSLMKYLKGPQQEHLEPLLITIWQQDNIYRTETTT